MSSISIKKDLEFIDSYRPDYAEELSYIQTDNKEFNNKVQLIYKIIIAYNTANSLSKEDWLAQGMDLWKKDLCNRGPFCQQTEGCSFVHSRTARAALSLFLRPHLWAKPCDNEPCVYGIKCLMAHTGDLQQIKKRSGSFFRICPPPKSPFPERANPLPIEKTPPQELFVSIDRSLPWVMGMSDLRYIDLGADRKSELEFIKTRPDAFNLLIKRLQFAYKQYQAKYILPKNWKTDICRNGTQCVYKIGCQFAHSIATQVAIVATEQLRYKTKPCDLQVCEYGSKCFMVHPEEEGVMQTPERMFVYHAPMTFSPAPTTRPNSRERRLSQESRQTPSPTKFKKEMLRIPPASPRPRTQPPTPERRPID